jgi:hypothetical protein
MEASAREEGPSRKEEEVSLSLSRTCVRSAVCDGDVRVRESGLLLVVEELRCGRDAQRGVAAV